MLWHVHVIRVKMCTLDINFADNSTQIHWKERIHDSAVSYYYYTGMDN